MAHRTLLLLSVALLFVLTDFAQKGRTITSARVVYVCSPCGYGCDTSVFYAPGICPSCHMPLVTRSSIKFKNISPSALRAYVASHPHAVLLDVRTREEFEGKADPNFGTLRQAINIPVLELESRLASIDSLKNREIIVYCSHAHRSAQASYLLGKNGFHKVTNMTGGVSVMGDTTYRSQFR